MTFFHISDKADEAKVELLPLKNPRCESELANLDVGITASGAWVNISTNPFS